MHGTKGEWLWGSIGKLTQDEDGRMTPAQSNVKMQSCIIHQKKKKVYNWSIEFV